MHKGRGLVRALPLLIATVLGKEATLSCVPEGPQSTRLHPSPRPTVCPSSLGTSDPSTCLTAPVISF